MKQLEKTETLSELTDGERILYLDSEQRLELQKQDVEAAEVGLEQATARLKVLQTVEPTDFERQTDRTEKVKLWYLRMRKAEDYVNIWTEELKQSKLAVLSAQEAVTMFKLRAQDRFAQRQKEDRERNLIADAIVSKLLDKGVLTGE